MSLLYPCALLLLAAMGLVGSYLDLRYRLLPNWLCAICLAGGLGFGMMNGGLPWVAMSALHAAIALAVGMALFAAGVIGGGDAKFYAAIAAWFPLELGILLLGTVAATGLVLVVGWLLLRARFVDAQSGSRANPDFGKVPYGLAISVGAVASFVIAYGLT